MLPPSCYGSSIMQQLADLDISPVHYITYLRYFTARRVLLFSEYASLFHLLRANFNNFSCPRFIYLVWLTAFVCPSRKSIIIIRSVVNRLIMHIFIQNDFGWSRVQRIIKSLSLRLDSAYFDSFKLIVGDEFSVWIIFDIHIALPQRLPNLRIMQLACLDVSRGQQPLWNIHLKEAIVSVFYFDSISYVIQSWCFSFYFCFCCSRERNSCIENIFDQFHSVSGFLYLFISLTVVCIFSSRFVGKFSSFRNVRWPFRCAGNSIVFAIWLFLMLHQQSLFLYVAWSLLFVLCWQIDLNIESCYVSFTGIQF